MQDNQRYLKEHLGKLGFGPRREEEIVRELSDHLADHATALEARGVASDVAAREALDSVSNWPKLRQEILAAETEEAIMNYRTKTFWLPGFAAFILSSGLLALFQFEDVVPRFYWLTGQMGSGHPFFAFYIGWLMTLPLVGAIAAFWSDRAGGRVLQRALAALAPSLGMLGFLIIAPVISLFIFLSPFFLKPRHMHFHLSLGLILIWLLTYFVNWVLLPAVGLLIGSWPFLRRSQPHA